MTRLRNLPEGARVYEVFADRPHIFAPFSEACEHIMRGPATLSAGQRELIGAFVSRLNSCPFCHDVHNEAVKAHGIDASLTAQLQEDIASAEVEENMKPLLSLAKKMTEGAYKVTDGDFEAARAAGWSDDAIEDAILVACLFNFMNRLVSTLDIQADDDYLSGAGPRIRDVGYSAGFERTLAQQSAG